MVKIKEMAKSKKAYMKTLEVLFAIIVTTLFIVILIPGRDISEQDEEKLFVMDTMINNPLFRQGVINLADGCYDSSNPNILTNALDKAIPEVYIYNVCINTRKTDFPEKRVIVETGFITGNMTDFFHKEIWLYYWIK